MVLKVAGAMMTASGGPQHVGFVGRLQRLRTGWPVRPASLALPGNFAPSEVATTSQPWDLGKAQESREVASGLAAARRRRAGRRGIRDR
jgi:hypothetical protein